MTKIDKIRQKSSCVSLTRGIFLSNFSNFNSILLEKLSKFIHFTSKWGEHFHEPGNFYFSVAFIIVGNGYLIIDRFRCFELNIDFDNSFLI